MRPDPALINRVINHPDVLPGLAPGRAYIQYAGEAFFAKPGNVAFGDADGLVLFFWKAPGVYAGHYLFTKALRGQAALLFCRKCLSDIFTQYGATTIVGTVPRINRASRSMTRALGFRPVGTSTDSYGRSCITYVLERDSWMSTICGESSPMTRRREFSYGEKRAASVDAER